MFDFQHESPIAQNRVTLKFEYLGEFDQTWKYLIEGYNSVPQVELTE
jgi:hypothetical protein